MTNGEPYDHYRELLTTLSGDEIPLTLLDEAGKSCGWWPTHRPWQRTYGRFHFNALLGDSPLVTLIYETTDRPQEICIIDLLPTFPATFTPEQTVIRRKGLGWFCLTRFPHDPQLPALQRHQSSLREATLEVAKVLRYRPSKRCTIRYTGTEPHGMIDDSRDNYRGEVRFAKLFTDDRGAAIHRESVALWQAAQAGELEFAVAQPIRWDDEQKTLWQGAVPGIPIVDRLLSNQGAALAEQMGQAAGSLPRSSLQPIARSDAKKQLKRSTKYAQRLRTFFPALRPAIDFLIDRLTTIHAEIEAQPLRPIHGAPHPHQWLTDGTRLGLVDFDGLALGDPELDVATFMSEMDFEDWEEVPVAAINRAFQRGYATVAGTLNPQLLNAYRAHKRLSKALRSAHAVRGDNDMRVERALGQTLVCVC